MNVYIWRRDDYSAMRGPYPEGFHIPSKDEWVALCGILTSTFGMASNATTMWTYLKMPMAGFRFNWTTIGDVGSYGYYWSATPSSSNSYRLLFDSSSLSPQSGYRRVDGFSLRWFKDKSVAPDSSWTTLYDWSSVAAGAWVFYSSTLWLISVSGDWRTWYTIQDKNLWATTVYNQWNTLTDANCGKFYQRGNNYGFSHSWTVTSSTTQVDASNYWPGNYYSSSTFISVDGDWSSVRNDDLRWWATWIQVVGHPIKNAYIGGYYEYSYDFRNKTISEFAADGWTYDSSKAPSFNSDWIYYTSMTSTTSGGIELNYSLTSAKKVTLNTSFVITNSTTHLWIWWIDSLSWTYLSWIMLTNMLGAHNQDIQINGSSVSTTSVSVSTWTYTETIEYDLTNKTYTYSWCYPASWTLTDEQISWIRNNNGITVAVGGSSGIKISTIDLVVEY